MQIGRGKTRAAWTTLKQQHKKYQKDNKSTYSLGITALGSLDLDTNTAIGKRLSANNLGVQLELEALLGEGAVEGLTIRSQCKTKKSQQRSWTTLLAKKNQKIKKRTPCHHPCRHRQHRGTQQR